MKVTILDGYVDEPSCLGVPPYISPYPRYIAGAVRTLGHDCIYLTIDQIRKGNGLSSDVLILIAGPIVPGRYLRGMPISQKEIVSISEQFGGTRILGGPLARFDMVHERIAKTFDLIAERDMDAFVYDLLSRGSVRHRNRDMDEWTRWAVLGSNVVRHHPDFPQPLIAEIDTWRGCVRYISGGCSFCIEPLYGKPLFRQVKDIISEVEALYTAGVRNFRLGGQSCVFSYQSEGVGETETPVPNPRAIGALLKGIRSVAPEIQVLHTDNANPAVIATHPRESREVAQLLVEHCTGGNVLAFGVESADPIVTKANNLNSSPEQVKSAVRLINEVGSLRSKTGLPHLLPGINFLSGLRGETKDTFMKNLALLRELLDEGLMVRRINIRQVSPVRGQFDVRKHYKEFRMFKSRVRQEIDGPMISRILPEGTILCRVYLEMQKGRTTFGRQVGTYPILVGLPYQAELNRFVDVCVLSHGFRSVTGVEFPLSVNDAPLDALVALPGIGRKRAARLATARPLKDRFQLAKVLDDEAVATSVVGYLKFNSE